MALLVSIGTDGRTDWVRLPDGQKLSLGAISVLRFVSSLAPAKEARHALASYLQGQEVIIPVDENRMWDLLAPVRSRWGSVGSFMPPDQQPRFSVGPQFTRTSTKPMNTKALRQLDQHINAMNKYAKVASAAKMAEGVSILLRLAAKVAEEDETQEEEGEEQSKQAAEQEETQDDEGQEKEASLAIDTILANREASDRILSKVEETSAKIDELVAAGRNFNASKAKSDLRAVTVRVASILQHSELTESWVTKDLAKLAARADTLHGLFASAKA